MDKDTWFKLTPGQQLGNIGSEIARARHWDTHKDYSNRQEALKRALGLFDLTLDDRRWGAGLKEIARFREVVAAWFSGQSFFDIPLKSLEDYCVNFVIQKKYNPE